ncbi:thioesterase II family protein [Almyronema epifaneia]|uniref:Thioesterase II family protein n=1 Tax=Almyronema epifaneia S1 TaxID=2991925 RepID=A0ABW6I9P9_9CYAN
MSSHAQLNPWIICPQPTPQARLRLFCFPYAGGGAAIFRAWAFQLPPEIEVCPIQLPGRENRFSQAPFTRMLALIHALSPALLPLCDRPFAFWGHSMGALVSFELARYWHYRGLACPQHLFLSSHQAPHLPRQGVKMHLLPEAEFIAELRRYNGTPAAILQEPELLELLLPVLRADFAVLETYTYRAGPPLPCAISVFGGDRDAKVSQKQLSAWQIHTQAQFKLRLLAGDHFYLKTQQTKILQAVREDLQCL